MPTRYSKGDVVYLKRTPSGEPLREKDGLRIVEKVEKQDSDSPDYFVREPQSNITIKTSASLLRKPDWSNIPSRPKLHPALERKRP